MTIDDSNGTSKRSDSTSEAVPTRRGRVPGPEAGFGRRLRLARGIETQAEVAARAEIARSAYARYETGGRYPSVPELRRLCDALSVTPEHLIFGDSGPGFEASPSPLNQMAPEGDSEQARITRHMLTGVLLNVIPKSESEAFRELIWASASQQLRDHPEALDAIVQICTTVTDNIWADIDTLVAEKFENDEKIKELVGALSDDEADSA